MEKQTSKPRNLKVTRIKNYNLLAGVSPDGKDYTIVIPEILRITNFDNVQEPYYIECYRPSNSPYIKVAYLGPDGENRFGVGRRCYKEGDIVKFSNSPGDKGQIILISPEMNLIMVQVGLDRARQVRFQFDKFTYNNLEVIVPRNLLI